MTGLLVQIDKDYYILPLTSVEACIDKKDAERTNESGREIIKYRDNLLRTFP
jgi:chemotaxis protein histidine kinase CheA